MTAIQTATIRAAGTAMAGAIELAMRTATRMATGKVAWTATVTATPKTTGRAIRWATC